MVTRLSYSLSERNVLFMLIKFVKSRKSKFVSNVSNVRQAVCAVDILAFNAHFFFDFSFRFVGVRLSAPLSGALVLVKHPPTLPFWFCPARTWLYTVLMSELDKLKVAIWWKKSCHFLIAVQAEVDFMNNFTKCHCNFNKIYFINWGVR